MSKTHSTLNSNNNKKHNQIYDTAIVKCDSYKSVKDRLRFALDKIGGLKKIIKKSDIVLLKPNLLTGSDPKNAVTTHPQIIIAIKELVEEIGATVIMGDSPSPTTNFSHAKKISQFPDIQVADFKNKITLIGKTNKTIRNFTIAKAYADADVIINLPKLKTHSLTTYTGAVKNLYGLIPGKTKLKYHLIFKHPKKFTDMLLDLYRITRPKVKLNIMDGILAHQGNGPFAGTPKKIGLIGVSKDALALDISLLKLSNLNAPLLDADKSDKKPDTHNKIYSEISSIHLKPPSATRNFAQKIVPAWAYDLLKDVFLPVPKINNKCIGCFKCVDICPANAMSKTVPVTIDKKKCIRCYCCHEICPTKAIKIR